MKGFLPGFAYMGHIPTPLRLPRKITPSPRIPRGSVAIADFQTAIYPSDSPGGWHVIGKTPISLFEDDDTPMMSPLDNVKFYPISLFEFENYTL